jgi:hypothetical protein
MDNITYVGLIDSHPESICGNHHTAAVIDKILLIPAAFLVRKTGVVLRR